MGLMAGMAIAAAGNVGARVASVIHGPVGGPCEAIAMPTPEQRAQIARDIAQAKLRGMSPQHRANHEAGLNGCHNREPFNPELWVQDGYHEAPLYTDGQGAWVTRTPRFKRVPFRMAAECQYTVDPMGQGGKDPRCAGCKWRRAP